MNNNIIQYAENVKLSATFEREINKVAKRKNGSEILAFTYGKTDLPDKEQKAKRIRFCGKTLVYAENPAGGDPILTSVMRCGIRLCPSCSWIRSRKIFENVYNIITDHDFAGKQFIFLTLTVKNCCSKFLDNEIKRLLSAWQILTANDRQPFRRCFYGTFRSLEVTYNPIKKTYHPHLHALAAVDSSYFKKSNKYYMGHAELRELWRKACELNYLPQCRIERVKNTKEKQVAEVAKYTVKSAEYLNRPVVLETLDIALKNKRLIAYGGLFREVKKRLNLPDENELEEFPRLTTEELMRNPYVRKIILEWKLGAYHVSLMAPSSDPAEWLKPGRLIAEDFRQQAAAWGQGV